MRRTGEIRRTAPKRSRVRDTGPSDEVVDAVLGRDSQRCAACGELVSGGRGWGWSVHHRMARKRGGSTRPFINLPGNLVLLCGHGSVGCHFQVESERVWAEAAGFIVRDGVTVPAAVPISHAVHGLVLLGDEGGYQVVDG